MIKFAVKNEFIRGLIGGIPVAVGYIPIAIAFGLLAVKSNIPVVETWLFSALVFAGASQFMAVTMLQTGCGIAEIVIAAFILNFRHFVMGLAFSSKLKKQPLQLRCLFSLGLTDETFSVVMTGNDAKTGEDKPWYVAGVILISYLAWIAGTILGTIFTGIIPASISNRMSMALYAMFIAFLVPSVTKEKRIILIVAVTAIINIVLSHFLAKGWALIISIIAGGIVGSFVLKSPDETPADEEKQQPEI